VVLRGGDTASYLRRIFTDQDYDLMISSLHRLPDPTLGVQRLFWSRNIIKGAPWTNGSGYSNPALDKIMEAAADEANPARRKALITQWQQIVQEDLPVLELIEQTWVTVSTARFHKQVAQGDGLFASIPTPGCSQRANKAAPRPADAPGKKSPRGAGALWRRGPRGSEQAGGGGAVPLRCQAPLAAAFHWRGLWLATVRALRQWRSRLTTRSAVEAPPTSKASSAALSAASAAKYWAWATSIEASVRLRSLSWSAQAASSASAARSTVASAA
jgi:hypothetical protein